MDGDIKSGHWLIGDDKLRFHDDGAGDADTLTLATAEFVWVTCRVFRDKANEFEDTVDLIVDVFLIFDAIDDEAFRDDVADGHTRI